MTQTASPDSSLAFILAGIFWGAVSLVTPCVFPMIPITVSFFLKQSEKEHTAPGHDGAGLLRHHRRRTDHCRGAAAVVVPLT